MGHVTEEEQRETRRLCSQVGILTRWGRLAEADDARTALAVVRARAVLTDLVETYPITAEQRAGLAAALASSPQEAPADEQQNGGRPGIPTGSAAANQPTIHPRPATASRTQRRP